LVQHRPKITAHSTAVLFKILCMKSGAHTAQQQV